MKWIVGKIKRNKIVLIKSFVLLFLFSMFIWKIILALLVFYNVVLCRYLWRLTLVKQSFIKFIWFIQDSVLFRVWFIQDSVLVIVWFIQDSVLVIVWFIRPLFVTPFVTKYGILIRMFRIMSILITFCLFRVMTSEMLGRLLSVFTLFLSQRQHIIVVDAVDYK
jgi:hypothetical protein